MDHIVELDSGLEMQILGEILVGDADRIAILPKGWDELFMAYMIQEELYEFIPKLESVKHKVSDKTFDELFLGK